MAQTKEGALKLAAAVTGLSVEEYAGRRASGEKFCMRCREWHAISEFGSDRTRSDGLDPSCRKSRNAMQRRVYQPIAVENRKPMGPPRKPPIDGDKVQARHVVNLDVRLRRRPNPNEISCFDCGHLGSDKRHEYDHHLGYDPEHHEAVQVVCTACHHKRHKVAATHCPHGHELNEENLIVDKNGHRLCRECRRARDRGRRDAEFWRNYRAERKRRTDGNKD